MQVRIDRNLLRGFVRRAKRRFPDEYIETLFGYADGKTYTVRALEELEHSTDIEPNELVIEDEIEPCEKRGKYLRLGTIHSHPQLTADKRIVADCAPSETDWIDQKEQWEVVTGICFLYQRGKQICSRTRFYLADALLDLERT